MLPVLFTIVIPAFLAKPVVVAVVLLLVGGRAFAAWRQARRAEGAGQSISLLQALKDDAVVSGILVAAAGLVWAKGLLDQELRLPLHAYGLLIATGFIAGIWLAQREARRRGQDADRLADLAFWILLSALAGSRVFFILVNWGDYFGPGRFMANTPIGRIPRILAVWEGGLVFYGGLIGATLVAWLYMKRHKLPFLAYADTMIPSVAIGHFFGRLGCFCAGCCWGDVAPGHLPWGAHFPPESLAYQTFAGRPDPAPFVAADRLHSLPLHESFGELSLFLLLVLLVRPRKRFHGEVLATWMLLYAILRSTVESFRGDVERGVLLGLGVGTWTSLVIFGIGAAIWLYGWRRRQAVAAEALA
jgi:phosphatidylglycerol:prolipoprotein diacylglycerol transferase